MNTTTEQTFPDEEDGFTNHEARLSQDLPVPAGLVEYKQVYNRIVVIASDIESVKPLQARLPQFLQTLEPISLKEAIAQDIRPEYNRLLQVSREEVNEMRDRKRGGVFFLAYSLFEYVVGYGSWIDLCDHLSCKWGRYPVMHAPGNTRSEQVLGGETTIAEIKQRCGFK